MEQGKKTRENKTPIKITGKSLKTNAIALKARLDTHSIPEEQDVNIQFLKRPEIAEKIVEMPAFEDVVEIMDHVRQVFKNKGREELYKNMERLEKAGLEILRLESGSNEEILAAIIKALRNGVLVVHPVPHRQPARPRRESHEDLRAPGPHAQAHAVLRRRQRRRNPPKYPVDFQ